MDPKQSQERRSILGLGEILELKKWPILDDERMHRGILSVAQNICPGIVGDRKPKPTGPYLGLLVGRVEMDFMD